MTTIVDITPRPPRRGALWLSVPVFVLALVVGMWIGRPWSKTEDERVLNRLQVERNAYLVTLCTLYDASDRDDGEAEAARELCACVLDSDNPAKVCNTALRVWAVLRDQQRCEESEGEEPSSYCACVEPVAQLVSRAGGMDVARRRAYGYDQCRTLEDAPPLPPPPAPERVADEAAARAVPVDASPAPDGDESGRYAAGR